MKIILNWALIVFITNNFLYSQQVTIPQKIDFQAVARDVTGSLVDDQEISVRMTILKQPLPGTVVYQEEHQVSTDQYGHFVLPIGAGNAIIESFHDVDWTQGPHFVKIELDAEGGADYVEMGTLELMTVPYAFYAKYAENINDADADPQNEIQQLGLQGEVLTIQGGNSVQLPDPSSENELQTLALGENNVLSISRGNSVQLSGGSSRWKEKGQSVYLEDGKVGVGLNSVPHTLSLFGQNQAYMSFLTSGTEIGLKNGFLIGLNKLSNTALIWNYERGEIRIGTDDKPRMLISTLGRVGIGTTAPSEKLTVNSATGDVGLRINSGENKSAQLFLSETQSGKRYGFNWEYDGSGNLFLRSEGYGNDPDELLIVNPTGMAKIGVDEILNIHGQEGENTVLSLFHEDYSGGLQMGVKRGAPFVDFDGEQLLLQGEGRTALSILGNSGFVGVGKENPNLPLDVEGSMEVSEDMVVKEDAEIEGTLTVGEGSTFDQIQEFTGTTGDGLANKSKDLSYPAGYNQANTRVLDLQIKFESKVWIGTGGGYVGYVGATAVSRDNSVRKITATLYENYIRIHYPAREDYKNKPFRILLLRMGAKS